MCRRVQCKRSGSRRSEPSGNSKADIFVTAVGSQCDAEGGADAVCIAVPRTSTQNAKRRVSGLPRRTVIGCAMIARMPSVLAPCPNVAVHVEEPERVGLLFADRMCRATGVRLVPRVLGQPHLVISERISRDGFGTR